MIKAKRIWFRKSLAILLAVVSFLQWVPANAIAAAAAAVSTKVADYIPGDVNDDGRVNSTDAVLVLRHAAGTLGQIELLENAADVNGDEKINSSDAVLILRRAGNLISAFPIE